MSSKPTMKEVSGLIARTRDVYTTIITQSESGHACHRRENDKDAGLVMDLLKNEGRYGALIGSYPLLDHADQAALSDDLRELQALHRKAIKNTVLGCTRRRGMPADLPEDPIEARFRLLELDGVRSRRVKRRKRR